MAATSMVKEAESLRGRIDLGDWQL